MCDLGNCRARTQGDDVTYHGKCLLLFCLTWADKVSNISSGSITYRPWPCQGCVVDVFGVASVWTCMICHKKLVAVKVITSILEKSGSVDNDYRRNIFFMSH